MAWIYGTSTGGLDFSHDFYLGEEKIFKMWTMSAYWNGVSDGTWTCKIIGTASEYPGKTVLPNTEYISSSETIVTGAFNTHALIMSSGAGAGVTGLGSAYNIVYELEPEIPYTLTLTPTKAGYTFEPVSRSYEDGVYSLRLAWVASEADPPNKATNPSPEHEDTEVDFSGLKLSWEDGGGADTFNVYIGKTGDLTLVSSAQAGTDYTTTIAELETIFDASPIDQKIYWRVDATNNTGTTEGDKWNFDARPAKATTPFPTDAMTTMTLDWSNFSWDEATTALTYDVYAGTETGEEVWDSNMTLIVKDGELHTLSQAYMLTVMNVVYPNTGVAVHNYTYYWKVNTKNAFGVTEGDFWSFTTIPFDYPAVSYILLGGGSGPYDIPPGVEGIDFRYAGENNMITVRRLIAAANNKIWIEDL